MDENTIISHIYQNHENGQWLVQTNEVHQKGVAETASAFAAQFGLPTWGRVLGLFHDTGKERHAFQQYIRMSNGLPVSELKHYTDHQHAFVGGKVLHKLIGKNVLNLLSNQIISHHTGLHDYIDAESILKERPIPSEIKTGRIDTSLLIKELRETPLGRNNVDMKHFHHLSRMLFSCLIDADRLDTERFMDYASWEKREKHQAISDLMPLLEKYINMLQSNAVISSVNLIRKEVQEQCRKTSYGEKGFYSLSVPTGGGKTIASLLWAMRHAVYHKMSRIIIAIPYTSIIVQTATLLKKIFGEENVLEHHSSFDPDTIKDEEIREKSKLATENWNYPIIVTTNVQLFESTFSNRTSVCRKLHNIVNSVIILDEVQTLPTDFLQPIVDAMKAYHELFGVSFLFTTASQPVLSGIIDGSNPKVSFNGIEHISEIIPPSFALHDKLRRVRIEIDKEGKTYYEIAAEIARYDKVLCIVNTRKDAKEVYERLPENGVKLHLSRMMCPDHISETIDKIRLLLDDASSPVVRVVATQLVEAGVDIDFPVVFRQEAGLDSILQAAGRCNREGKSAIGHTFVFSLASEGRIPSGTLAAANNARLNLPEECDWFSPSVMEMYFHQLYCRTETFDRNDIKHYLYNPNELCFQTASDKFKLINDDSINVIVTWKNSMDLVEKLKQDGCTYHLMKNLSKFTVGVHHSDFNRLVKCGFINEVIEDIYVLADSSQYDKATGLRLDNHWAEEVLMV